MSKYRKRLIGWMEKEYRPATLEKIEFFVDEDADGEYSIVYKLASKIKKLSVNKKTGLITVNTLPGVAAEPDRKSIARAMKSELISDFNAAVDKGASEPFLKSLYSKTVSELSELNGMLELDLRDGIEKLNTGWSS